MRNPETRFETRPTRPNRDFQIARNTSHPFRPFTVPNHRRVVVHRPIHPSTPRTRKKKSLNENRIRTCALRSNPPVDPPKIGLGVFGLSLGAVHGAGAAGAAAAFSSARTTRCVPREEGARRVVARGVVPTERA